MVISSAERIYTEGMTSGGRAMREEVKGRHVEPGMAVCLDPFKVTLTVA
jgi:hypothetical protein